VRYQKGSLGRVFILKFEDKDDILHEIKQLALKETIKAGTITLIGGMRSAGIVSGPQKTVIPPDPLWVKFDDTREVLGVGTLFWNGDEPIIHIHGAMGRERETLTGCIRKDCSVFLVVEAIITEIIGTNAHKALNKETGLVMLEV